jgi:hypothetical protein
VEVFGALKVKSRLNSYIAIGVDFCLYGANPNQSYRLARAGIRPLFPQQKGKDFSGSLKSRV